MCIRDSAVCYASCDAVSQYILDLTEDLLQTANLICGDRTQYQQKADDNLNTLSACLQFDYEIQWNKQKYNWDDINVDEFYCLQTLSSPEIN